MKKRIIYVALTWFLCLGHAMADEIVINDVTIPQKGTVNLTVGFDFTTTIDKVGFTFSLALPEGLSLLKDGDGDLVYVKDESSIAKLNIVAAGDGNVAGQPANETATIKGTSGTLLTLTLCADANMVVGSTHTVNVTNCTFQERVDGVVKDINLEPFSFTVTISESSDGRVLLDETSTTAPTASDGEVNVRVNRTINANEWSTICLPFAMTAEQVKAAFGNDVQLGDFTGYDTVEDAAKNVVGLKINFNKVTAIAGNHPYVIRVSSGITQFTADNVTIAPEVEPCVEYDNGQTGKKRVVWGTFTGTYVADYVIPYSGEDVSLFLSGNQLYYASAKTKHMKAYRACFWFSDILTTTGDASAPITMSFNDATGISVSTNNQGMRNEGWYTIGGVKLSAEPTKKGLYIHNGNKEVIK